MRKSIIRTISLVLLLAFFADTACYGLATPPVSQNPVVKREILAALQRTQIRYAVSEDAVRLLDANNAECLLLSSGKYLVTKGVAQNDLRLLRAIIHEDIEAIMQILAKEDRYKYQGIKELILKYFPPSESNSLLIDLYVNHTIARAFEWLIFVEQGMIFKGEIPADKKDFIKTIEPIIRTNKHNYFTAEFWDSKIRGERLKQALNNGMIFYQVASGRRIPISRVLAEKLPEGTYGIDLFAYDKNKFNDYRSAVNSLCDLLIEKQSSGLFMVSIDGLSGVGKSTLATNLVDGLGVHGRKAVVIKRDWFLWSHGEAKKDEDSARMDYIREVLEKIRMFSSDPKKDRLNLILSGLYNSKNGAMDREEEIVIDHNTIVIMDGGRNIESPWKEYFDFRIAMLTDPEMALNSRLRREAARGYISADHIGHTIDSFKETSEQFIDRVRRNRDNVDLFVLLEDYKHPMFITKKRKDEREEVISSDRALELQHQLDSYYVRLKEEIKPNQAVTVEERILSLLLHAKLRGGSLKHIGYRRTGGGNLRTMSDYSGPDLLEEIRYFTSRGLPIEAMISAYSFKVRNPLRSYPQSFDLGEIAGLYRLKLITELVKEIYSPGMTFTIIADGRKSANIYIDDSLAGDMYRETMQELIRVLSLQEIISMIDLDEILPPEFDKEYKKWAASLLEVEDVRDPVHQRIIDTAINTLDWSGYSQNDMARIISEGPKCHPKLFAESKNRAIRYLAMQRAVKELGVYKKAYPHKIRFTFHPKPGQVAINIVNSESRVAPWHGVGGLKLDGTPIIDYRASYENNPNWIPVYYNREDSYPAYFKEIATIGTIPALIFASGKGSRLAPITTVRNNTGRIFTKTVLPVGNIPNVEILLKNAIGEGIRKFYVTLGHEKEVARDVLERYGDNVIIIEREGEASKPKLAQDIVLGTHGDKFTSDVFWVLHTDVVCPNTPYGKCYKYFADAEGKFQGLLGCMGVVFKSYGDFKIDKEETRGAFNPIIVDGDNRIVKVYRRTDISTYEKFMRIHAEFCRTASPEVARMAYDPEGRPLLPTNASFYLLKKDILDDSMVKDKLAFDIEVFGSMPGRIIAYFMDRLISDAWQHIAQPEDLLDAQSRFLKYAGYAAPLLELYTRSSNVANNILGENAKVDDSANLRGCVVGSGCLICNSNAVNTLFLEGTVVDGIDFKNAIVSGDLSLPTVMAALRGNSITKVENSTILAGDDGKIYISNNFTPDGSSGRHLSRMKVLDYDINRSNLLYDTEPTLILWNDLLYAQLQSDRVYEIKYDISRLTVSQIEIVEEYARLLQLRSSNPDSIKLRPLSSAQGSKESLIAVYCTGKDFKGEGHVDVAIPNGELKEYLLRIAGMVNIALASSNIPDNLSREEVDKYRPIMSYIKNQYKAILGEELAIPDSPEDILKVIRRIVLGLPKSMRMNTDQIEEFNRLAKAALTAA